MTRLQRLAVIAGAFIILAVTGSPEPAAAFSFCRTCASSCQAGFHTQYWCDEDCFGWDATHCFEDTAGFCALTGNPDGEYVIDCYA